MNSGYPIQQDMTGQNTANQQSVQHAGQQSNQQPQFAQQAPLAQTEQIAAEVPLAPQLNLNGSVATNADERAVLPRDILLQKVRQYRETQGQQRANPPPQQLAMEVEHGENPLDTARRLANEIVKSPFDAKNLDVPAFLRRKQGQGIREDDDSLPLG